VQPVRESGGEELDRGARNDWVDINDMDFLCGSQLQYIYRANTLTSTYIVHLYIVCAGLLAFDAFHSQPHEHRRL
jgi:hypothetical protein